MAKELLTRDQVNVEDTWNLKDMYSSDSDWEEDIKVILGKTEELVKFEGRVCESADTLLQVLELSAFISEKLEFAYNYAARLFDEDQGNTLHQSMNQKIFSIMAKISSDVSFIDPEILACDESKLEEFYNKEPKLDLYKKQIKEVQRLKAHTLSAEMEKVVAMTAEIPYHQRRGWGRGRAYTRKICSIFDVSK